MSAFDCGNIEVEDFLECLDIDNVSMATTEEYVFSCPFPGHSDGDQKPSAYMNAETTQWFCHGCHRKGNAVSFTAQLLEVSPLKAIKLLKERYQPGYINPEAVSIVGEVAKIFNKPDPVAFNQPLDESLVDLFAVDWDAANNAMPELLPESLHYIMRQRDFDVSTLKHWDFGYDTSSDRITFALRDDLGRLIGFKGRAWRKDHQPKYMFLGDKPGRSRYGFPIAQSSQFVFGLSEAAKHGDHLILCEGELNAIALWQMGIRTACAVNGSNFSAAQAKLIRKYADTVTVFFDTDRSGEDGTMMVRDALRAFVKLRIVEPHEGDPAEMDEDQAKHLIDSAQSDLVLALNGR